jgi:WD40 repeat protein
MATKAKKSESRRSGKPASDREPATEKDVRVRVFKGHENRVLCVAMPSDGQFALTSSDDGTVRRWELGVDVANWKIICKAEAFCGLGITTDGNYAAAGDSAGVIHFLDLSSSKELTKTEPFADSGVIDNLVFAADDREVLSATEHGILVRASRVLSPRTEARSVSLYQWIAASSSLEFRVSDQCFGQERTMPHLQTLLSISRPKAAFV